MRDLIDFHAIWNWCVEKWRTSFVVFVVSVASFMVGTAYQNKQIIDDCKFMGSFRDGIQAYNCQPRAR